MKKFGKFLTGLLFSLALAGLLIACGDNTATAVPATTALSTTAPAAITTSSASTTAAAAPPTTVASSSATPAISAASTTAAPAPTLTPLPIVAQPAGAIKLTFWYGLGGFAGNEIRQIVNKFNQSQSKYYVEPIFQASYEDTINKLNAALAGGNLPNIAQVYDGGTQRMIDSKRVVAAQDFIDRDKLQSLLDDIEPALRNHYTVNGKLYPMPFNSSTAVLYIDKKAFREVGLDPEKKIWTYDEMVDASKKLVKKDATGKVVRTGLAVWPEPWHIEQELAIHNGFYAEPGNGNQAQRATKYVFNNDTSVKYLEFLKKIVDEGGGIYYGANGRTAANAAYLNGETAFHFDSSASLGNYIQSNEKGGNKIEVGVIFMPRRSDGQGRTAIGGASLWVTDQGTKEQQEGAWEFIKFATSSDVQSVLAANTGYFGVFRSAYQTEAMKQSLAKYPQFQVAIDQIRYSPISTYNGGIQTGTFTSARDDVKNAMDAYLSGKVSSAKAALDDAAKKANAKLEEYNSTVK